MKTRLLALALVTAVTPLAMATPAAAQSRADQYQWEQAQRRFANEQAIFDQARARYEASRRRGYGGYGGSGRYGWKEGPDWEPSRYYRDDPNYQERPLSSQDEVYRGNDGRYYCRRSDGTTGLVVGAGVGALTGRAIDGGRNRATGTIVGGVLGALIGREVERSSDMRCR